MQYENILAGHGVMKRGGQLVPFDASKIEVAIQRAYLDVHKGAGGERMKSVVAECTSRVVTAMLRDKNRVHHQIEDIQDQVELALMRVEPEVARGYILYRSRHAEARVQSSQVEEVSTEPELFVTEKGQRVQLDVVYLRSLIEAACANLGREVTAEPIFAETRRNLYDGVPMESVFKAAILASRTLIEKEPGYTKATARLLLHTIRKEILGEDVSQEQMGERYAECFPKYIKRGIKAELLDEKLQQFDLAKLGAALDASRDLQFDYLGLQTLYDRYFLHIEGERIELPQTFFMRVAMGLALGEIDREARAIEFYNVLSTFDFMSSTPTLFNAGTRRSQLSSCFLTTVADDLDGIYEAIKENALLSKFAGGLGNDWTNVRSLGSHIKGTNGKSQGIVPFLKVANDTAVAVNQGGKRQGAVCAFLETWHLDIEEFLELRKNTGDDRRRTHDMNTANWVPDLFMRRVMEGGEWTLFSPATCPDLHDLIGAKFEQVYTAYEAMADRGEIKLFKRVAAKDLWRRMLTMLFETGHPWITFKDACNVRSPQQHAGVVHSSNLCTEITLNTSDSEIAVCNLGSVNLAQHLVVGADGQLGIDHAKLQKTVRIAMRMLDNVIDINFYAVKKARDANLRHRPVGLGIMGFQDCLYKLRTPYASEAAVEFADRSMEAVCYYAYSASADLASERGRYSSFKGSLWDKGILPFDSIDLLANSRGGYLEVDRSMTLDWDALRAKIAQHGMRNSNCVAIAPTATISNIIGVDASIEPCFGNLSVKSNISGEFTVVNEYLVDELKKLGMWDTAMLADLKYFNGGLAKINRIPEDLRALFATAFEVDAKWLVEAGSRRQKWIDQAQSLNIYLAGASGKKLDETYKLAWLRGLKTTYYLRTMGATHAEKSTVEGRQLNAVPSAQPAAGGSSLDAVAAQAKAMLAAAPATDVRFCGVDDPTCEACQ